MMNLDQLFILAERLRKEAIGEPEWIAEKHVYEYKEHSARVVAVLKIMRAAQGVAALNRLCRSGLFIDFGALLKRAPYRAKKSVAPTSAWVMPGSPVAWPAAGTISNRDPGQAWCSAQAVAAGVTTS